MNARRTPLGDLGGNESILLFNNALCSSSTSTSNSLHVDLARKASLQALTGQLPPAAVMSDDAGAQLEIGDTVAVPGGMTGTVKYLGPVEGKKGMFAGVELSREFAPRGKNDGDVDGRRYFSTSVQGAGIFLPSHRAMRQYSPTISASTFPPTPTTPSFADLKLDRAASSSRSPPTPGLPRFSQSLGPGAKNPFSQSMGPSARAPSPTQRLKPKSRPSLPRPESPTRRPPVLLPTPAKPGLTPIKGSVRGIRPSAATGMARTPKPSTPIPQRQSRTKSQSGPLNSSPFAESTPTPFVRSKADLHSASGSQSPPNQEEINRLKRELEERDIQLKDQANALAEMESNLSEVQSLVAASTPQNGTLSKADTLHDGADASELRSIMKAKDDKIHTMQTEFDSHRAQFRSTLDALQVSYAETERIYEQQQKDLEHELESLRTNQADIGEFARQVEEMEHSVVEMEQDLENTRRDVADKSAEIEHLKGELEVVRLEARREREKAVAASRQQTDGPASPATVRNSRDMAARDDEIKGLKLIIHSLSSGKSTSPQGRTESDSSAVSRLEEQLQSLRDDRTSLQNLLDGKRFREEELERENARLRNASGIGNDHMAVNGNGKSNGNGNGITNSRQDFHPHHKNSNSASSYQNAPANRSSNDSAATVVRPGTADSFVTPPQGNSERSPSTRPHSGQSPAAAEPYESSTDGEGEVSGAETDTQWCEMCETSGHDILHCTQAFGGGDGGSGGSGIGINGGESHMLDSAVRQRRDTDAQADSSATPSALKTFALSPQHRADDTPKANGVASFAARSSAERERERERDEPSASGLSAGDGPAPGKASGRIDMGKWCAMCERDGHDSVDCPFEDF